MVPPYSGAKTRHGKEVRKEPTQGRQAKEIAAIAPPLVRMKLQSFGKAR